MSNPLKWYGSKAKLADWIVSHAPTNTKEMYEPFFGTGAVTFAALQSGKMDYCIASDANYDIINFWQTVQNRKHHTELCHRVVGLRERHDEENYYVARDVHNHLDGISRAANFYYLNKTGFNGLWRINKEGKCNVPSGKRADFKTLSLTELEHYATLLEKVTLIHSPYHLMQIYTGAWIYLDPPYLPDTASKQTTDYGCEFDILDLAYWVAQITHNSDNHVMLSHTDSEDINMLFGVHLPHIKTKPHQFVSSSKIESRRPVLETLLTNY